MKDKHQKLTYIPVILYLGILLAMLINLITIGVDRLGLLETTIAGDWKIFSIMALIIFAAFFRYTKPWKSAINKESQAHQEL